jgi:hypothetical protein
MSSTLRWAAFIGGQGLKTEKRVLEQEAFFFNYLNGA